MQHNCDTSNDASALKKNIVASGEEEREKLSRNSLAAHKRGLTNERRVGRATGFCACLKRTTTSAMTLAVAVAIRHELDNNGDGRSSGINKCARAVRSIFAKTTFNDHHRCQQFECLLASQEPNSHPPSRLYGNRLGIRSTSIGGDYHHQYYRQRKLQVLNHFDKLIVIKEAGERQQTVSSRLVMPSSDVSKKGGGKQVRRFNANGNSRPVANYTGKQRNMPLVPMERYEDCFVVLRDGKRRQQGNDSLSPGKSNQIATFKTRAQVPKTPYQINSTFWFHLLLTILPLILSSVQYTTLCQEIEALSRQQQEFAREMADLMTITPLFAPTRKPQPQPSAAAERKNFIDAVASAAQHQTRASKASTTGGHQQARAQVNDAGKFVRINELDAFLDDMNHNELRIVAAGMPIQDLFHAKPMPPKLAPDGQQDQARVGAGNEYYRNTSSEHNQAPQTSAGNNHERRSLPNETTGLMGSHSEQQIYSECALILQRTYVKSMDDPK